MRRTLKVAVALAATAAATFTTAGVANAGAKGSAVPAGFATWGGATPYCGATFVRSASGLVNETNRDCSPYGNAQNPYVSEPVWVQFRPVDGVANPACDVDGGLVSTPGDAYSSYTGGMDSSLLTWFEQGRQYNVCWYLVNPQVASGTVDAGSFTDTAANLPADLSGGRFKIAVSGTWTNIPNAGDQVDAEYLTHDSWTTIVTPDIDQGDLQVNDSFVNWGSYNSGHQYSLSGVFSSPINLGVFDGDASTNAKNAGWYWDNDGQLNYTVTFLGK